jgi:hypothetical protein
MRSFSRDQLLLVIILTVVIVALTLVRYLLWY